MFAIIIVSFSFINIWNTKQFQFVLFFKHSCLTFISWTKMIFHFFCFVILLLSFNDSLRSVWIFPKWSFKGTDDDAYVMMWTVVFQATLTFDQLPVVQSAGHGISVLQDRTDSGFGMDSHWLGGKAFWSSTLMAWMHITVLLATPEVPQLAEHFCHSPTHHLQSETHISLNCGLNWDGNFTMEPNTMTHAFDLWE